MHALWFTLDTETQSHLQSIINELAHKHNTSLFLPHLTLAGPIENPYDEIISSVQKICSGQKERTITGNRVEYSTTFYQCVFLKIQPSIGLMEMHKKAIDLLHLNKHVPYWPHISLVYGDIDIATREKIATEIDIEPLTIQINGIDVIEIGDKDGIWNSDKWNTVATCPMVG